LLEIIIDIKFNVSFKQLLGLQLNLCYKINITKSINDIKY